MTFTFLYFLYVIRPFFIYSIYNIIFHIYIYIDVFYIKSDLFFISRNHSSWKKGNSKCVWKLRGGGASVPTNRLFKFFFESFWVKFVPGGFLPSRSEAVVRLRDFIFLTFLSLFLISSGFFFNVFYAFSFSLIKKD